MSKRTPWGVSQGQEVVAEGVVFHSTASHGGYNLDAKRNAKVNPVWRRQAGWYEEDCDWAIVAYTFPELFPSEARERAVDTLKNWLPFEWEAITGKKLRPGESHVKDQSEFDREHAGDYVSVSAVGDWSPGVPKGFVKVSATPGGARKYIRTDLEVDFLVPAAEYKARGSFGFVIDFSRHPLA